MQGKEVSPHRHSQPHFGISIADFGFGPKSKIQNLKSKMDWVERRFGASLLLPRNCKGYESRNQPLLRESAVGRRGE
jgi:hypothetical protein